MSERSGFYPSNEALGIKNEYTGYEFGNLYKHIISNGVFATPSGTPSDFLQVVATTGLTVNVKPGAGIFLNQWYENDDVISFILDGETTYNRIDLIVVEANKSPNVLTTKVKLLKGTASSVPVAPTPIDSETVKQYPLAKITITAGVVTITQSAIEDLRGVAPTLWVTGLIQQLDTTTLWNQFNAAFWEWFANVKDTLASTTLMRKYTGYTYSTVANQNSFEIPISQYNSVLDILQVHIEGRILREGVDYIKNGLTGITLSLGLPVVNTLVYFEIFKSVDGSDAESVASLLYSLETTVNASRVTSATGTAKVNIVSSIGQEVLNAGVGYHTIYVPATVSGMPVDNKVWRGYSNFTDAANGHIFVVSHEGDVYTINCFNGTWGVWRAVYKNTVKSLYNSTGNIMGVNSSVVPTKTLLNCANGWVLHFAKLGSTGDSNFHYHLPKVRYDGSMWDGQNIIVDIVSGLSDTGVATRVAKKLLIYNDRIRGFSGNDETMALVAVTEY